MGDSTDSPRYTPLHEQVLAHRLKEARDRLDLGVATLSAENHLTPAQKEDAMKALLAAWDRERAAATREAAELAALWSEPAPRPDREHSIEHNPKRGNEGAQHETNPS